MAGMRNRELVSKRVFTAGVVGAVVCGSVGLLLAGGNAGKTLRVGSSSMGGVPPAAPLPTGVIDLARNTGTGPFQSGVGQVSVSKPNGIRLATLFGRAACCLAWSEGTRTFALRVGQGGLGRLEVVRGAPRHKLVLQPVTTSLRLTPGAWLPSGRGLALGGIDPQHPARNGIYSLDLAGHLQQISQTRDRRPELPLAYSPRGNRLLVFRRAGGGFGQLYVMNATGIMTRIGTDSVMCCYFGSPASWSPDGRRITFAGFADPHAQDAGQSAVFVVDSDGTHLRRITEPGEWTTSARWSPRGDWIVFDRVNRSPTHAEFLVRPDGSGTRIINTQTTTGGGSCCAQWSPDGRYLAYEYTAGSTEMNVALYVVNTTGPPHPVAVTATAHGYLTFSWLP